MHELVVWGAMVGGLLTLAALALAEWLAEWRSVGAWRNLVFVVLVGGAAIVVVGLPETLWPALDGRPWRVLRASLGPLAASVTLFYLGQWMGGMREDVVVSRITSWSAAVMMVLALGLALAALLLPADRFRAILIVTAVCNVGAVLPALAAALRAAMLGDRLARWMALAVAALGGMTAGLYLHGLRVPGLGLGGALVTVALTLTYFTLAWTLVRVRTSEWRRLARLSLIQPGVEPATPLPTGSHLLRPVEDALWTAARRQAQVGVACLYLDNLYEPLEDDDRSSEYQILVAMAARIRRAAGFRCVVGIYHPRCFVVLITLDADHQAFGAALNRLRAYAGESIELLGPDRPPQRFAPRVGLGVVVVDAEDAVARVLLDQAEQEARASVPEALLDTQY